MLFGKVDKNCAQKYPVKSNMTAFVIQTGVNTNLKNGFKQFLLFIAIYWPKMSAIAYLFQKKKNTTGAPP